MNPQLPGLLALTLLLSACWEEAARDAADTKVADRDFAPPDFAPDASPDDLAPPADAAPDGPLLDGPRPDVPDPDARADATDDGPLTDLGGPDAAIDATPDGPLPEAAPPDGSDRDAGWADVDPTDGTHPDVPGPDVAPPDGAAPDAPEPDAALPDLPELDAALPDVPELDAALPDGPEPDAPIPDMAPDLPEPDLAPPDAAPPPAPLAIDELVPLNLGTAVDADGHPRPWIEVVAQLDEAVDLAEWGLAVDDGEPWALADAPLLLDPGARRLLFLPFELPRGATLHLLGPASRRRVVIPDDLPPDHALARFGAPLEPCRWATPGAPNGDACEPPPWPEPPPGETFEEAALPDPYPAGPRPLVLTELGLNPAPGFVEVLNAGDAPVALDGWSVRIAHQSPGEAWPDAEAGAALEWRTDALAPGQRTTLAVLEEHTADLLEDPLFEGTVTLFDPDGAAIDRVDFMHWPARAYLARPGPDDRAGHHRFCAEPTPGTADWEAGCDPLPSRPVGDRLRHIRTPGDWDALAAGNVNTGWANVKVVVDLDAGEVVHLLGNERWDLHYTFVRELIDGDPHLSRCIPAEESAFNQGWYRFSVDHYFSDDRRYILANFYRYGANGRLTMEYTNGDRITPGLMRRGFLAAMRTVPDPHAYALRPSGPSQYARYHQAEGQDVPIYESNADRRHPVAQPLVPGVAYGWLRYVPGDALDPALLGPDTILVTDEAPADLPFVAGLVAEQPQSPNAEHVVRMIDRGTPNISVAEARRDPRIGPYLDQLVRFEVWADTFYLEPAEPEELDAWLADRRRELAIATPDLETVGILPLAQLDTPASIGAAGTHASYAGSLSRLESNNGGCPGLVGAPAEGFALAVSHGRDHLLASGAAALLPSLDDPREVRHASLEAARDAIRAHPVDPEVIGLFADALEQTFAGRPVRVWPSSTAAGARRFSGAGLYAPRALPADPDAAEIEGVLKDVWASQWTAHADDERAYHGIAPDAVGMAVFVLAAPTGAIDGNGSSLTRDLYFPLLHYHVLSLQRGLSPATWPAPGVHPEEIRYNTRTNTDKLDRWLFGRLSPDAPVLDNGRVNRLVCRGQVIESWMRNRVAGGRDDPWFMVDVTWWAPAGGEPVIERVRPLTFGPRVPPPDCREL